MILFYDCKKCFLPLRFYPRHPVVHDKSYTKKRQLYRDENARANTAGKPHEKAFDSILGNAYRSN